MSLEPSAGKYENTKRYRARNRARGRCIVCGGGPLATLQYCAECRTQQNRIQRESKQRRRIQIRKDGLVCVCCMLPMLEGDGHRSCYNCRHRKNTT